MQTPTENKLSLVDIAALCRTQADLDRVAARTLLEQAAIAASVPDILSAAMAYALAAKQHDRARRVLYATLDRSAAHKRAHRDTQS
jgi:hypothetical protein